MCLQSIAFLWYNSREGSVYWLTPNGSSLKQGNRFLTIRFAAERLMPARHMQRFALNRAAAFDMSISGADWFQAAPLHKKG